MWCTHKPTLFFAIQYFKSYYVLSNCFKIKFSDPGFELFTTGTKNLICDHLKCTENMTRKFPVFYAIARNMLFSISWKDPFLRIPAATSNAVAVAFSRLKALLPMSNTKFGLAQKRSYQVVSVLTSRETSSRASTYVQWLIFPMSDGNLLALVSKPIPYSN